MKTSNKGLELLKKLEGFSATAYKDGAGVWTIGYGNTVYANGDRVKSGEVITKEAAADLMLRDLVKKEKLVNALLGTKVLTQSQFDAVMLFAYNIGVGAFSASTVFLLIKTGRVNDFAAIEKAWLMWDKIRINGVLTPSKGLTNRRLAELALYKSV